MGTPQSYVLSTVICLNLGAGKIILHLGQYGKTKLCDFLFALPETKHFQKDVSSYRKESSSNGAKSLQ